MARFILVGINARGELQRIELLAENPDEASQEGARVAKRVGIDVVEISAAAAGSKRTYRSSYVSVFTRSDKFNLSLFVYEIMALLTAGLSLPETLETLDERRREKRSNTSGRTTASYLPGELARQMREGKSFANALASHPTHFPALFIAMIAASEQTGGMAQALERFLQYNNQVSVARQKLISASLYPALLLMTGAGVAFFLVWFLAPRFAHVYEGTTHSELPVLSKWLIDFGMFVSDHTVQSLVFLLATVATSLTFALKPSVQQRVLAALGRISWIGGMLKLIQLARFYRSLGMLLQGGVSLLPSLRMTQDILPFPLRDNLHRTMVGVGQGKPLSDSLYSESLMTPVALRLVRAGEQNGQIASMLEQSALFHEHEITQWVERFARLIEPVLMLIMGLGIGLIVVLLYLPIFDLAGSLQ